MATSGPRFKPNREFVVLYENSNPIVRAPANTLYLKTICEE